jgi:hypothetical protein
MKRKLNDAFDLVQVSESTEKVLLHSAVIEVPTTVNAGQHITVVVRGRRDETDDSLMMEVEISPWSSQIIVHPDSVAGQLTFQSERGHQIIASPGPSVLIVPSDNLAASLQEKALDRHVIPYLPCSAIELPDSSSSSLCRALTFNNAIWASHQLNENSRIFHGYAATAQAHREGA